MNRKFLTRSRNDRASLGQGIKNRKCPQGDFMKNDIEEAKDVQSLTGTQCNGRADVRFTHKAGEADHD